MRITFPAFAVLAAAFAFALPAQAAHAESGSSTAVALRHVRHEIRWQRSTTWSWQDRAGLRRSPTVYSERGESSLPYLRWVRRLWNTRRAAARAAAIRYEASVPTLWLASVRWVQRIWPGSSGWLISCSSSEGGWGIWVWNGGAPYASRNHGSSAGGWMQYMLGTWWHDYVRAVADARSRGFTIPRASASWLSPLGQAIAAGWAYGHDRPAGKWTGTSC